MKTNQLFGKAIFTAMFATAMAFGSSSVFAQVKIGTAPTVIDPANNLEVQASTTGNKVSINKTTGKVTIADGSQANERILTSDANGVSTWKDKAALRVDETIFLGEQGDPYLVTDWGGVFNALKDRVPLNVRSGSLNGYDPVEKQYTIQEAGYYRVFGGSHLVGTLPAPQVTRAAVYLSPWSVINDHTPISTADGPVLPVFWQGYLPVGSKVGIWITNSTNGGGAQNVVAYESFLAIIKLF